MKIYTAIITLLFVISCAMAFHLYKNTKQQEVQINTMVLDRVAHAELNRGLATSLIQTNYTVALSTTAYLLFMDTCLADMANYSPYSKENKTLYIDAAKQARELFNEPALASLGNTISTNGRISRALWPLPKQENK